MTGPEHAMDEPTRSQPQIDEPAPTQAEIDAAARSQAEIDRAARRQVEIDAVRQAVERDPRPQEPQIRPQLTP